MKFVILYSNFIGILWMLIHSKLLVYKTHNFKALKTFKSVKKEKISWFIRKMFIQYLLFNNIYMCMHFEIVITEFVIQRTIKLIN